MNNEKIMQYNKCSMFKPTLISVVLCLGFVSCSDFLTREPDNVFSNEDVFNDASMTKSVIAGFYNNVSWGPNFENFGNWSSVTGTWGEIDEATTFQTNASTTYSDALWRLYPYGNIRNYNLFLESLRSSSILPASERNQYIAETRFLRACNYFYMVRGLGGMPIVGDRVFKMTDNVEDMRLPRSTESAMYDYIISECDSCAKYLPSTDGVHQARASKWAALMLKARAAITAGSLAKYNNLITPELKTEGGEVGIPEDKAEFYYKIAADAAKEIIESKTFSLYRKYSDKSENFYRLFVDKDNNPEIIWVRDYALPDVSHSWSQLCTPQSVTGNAFSHFYSPLLNLVEAYEYVDNRDGHLKITDAKGDYAFYKNIGDLFKGKDPRLKGTIVCPGDSMDNKPVPYQAGQMYQKKKGTKYEWKFKTGASGSIDDDGDVITSINEPRESSQSGDNSTGFNFRKYVDPIPANRTVNGSDVWFIRMRYAEVLLIYAEAELELGNSEKGLPFINDVRDRAGLHALSDYTLDDIEQERRVEFPLENQRWWDLKRWRRAHTEWNGTSDDSQQWGLMPYLVKGAVKKSDKNKNGMWVFIKVKSQKMPNYRSFRMRNYYNFLDNGWLTNNPKLVKNPFQ